MSTLDDRIGRALRAGAQVPTPDRADPHEIVAGVATRVRRRRARRRAAGAVASLAVLVAIVVAGSALLDPGEDEVRVGTRPTEPVASSPAPPSVTPAIRAAIESSLPDYRVDAIVLTRPTEAVVNLTLGAESVAGARLTVERGSWTLDPTSACRIPWSAALCAPAPPDARRHDGAVPLGPDAYGGAPVAVEAVLPSAGLTSPVAATADGTWVAADDPATGNPTRVVRVRPDGTIDAEIDLRGDVLSLADGEGAWWVLTRERSVDADGVAHRVKRVDPARPDQVVSNPVAPRDRPAGPIVVGTSAAWVPTEAGVARFDARRGAFVARVDLGSEQAERAAAVAGDGMLVADGNTIARIEADGTVARTAIGLDAPVVSLAATGDAVWAVAGNQLLRLDPAGQEVQDRFALPVGLTDPTLATDGTGVVVSGTADLAPRAASGTTSVANELVALIVGDEGIESTVVVTGIPDPSEGTATAPSGGDLVVVKGGGLYRVATG